MLLSRQMWLLALFTLPIGGFVTNVSAQPYNPVSATATAFDTSGNLLHTTITVVNRSTATIATSTTMEVVIADSSGTPIVSLPVTTDAAGNVTIPPPPIPASVGGKGQLFFHDPTAGVSGLSVVWGTWTWYWMDPVLDLDPIGMPGASDQNWFIKNPSSVSVMGISGKATFVDSSSFKLSYTPTTIGAFDVIVSGDDSFIKLADGTYIAFADGLKFGALDSHSAHRNFNFSAIGLSGDWSYDSGSDYTGAVVTSSRPFSAPAIALTSVPESRIWIMFIVGFGIIGMKMRAKPNRTVHAFQ